MNKTRWIVIVLFGLSLIPSMAVKAKPLKAPGDTVWTCSGNCSFDNLTITPGIILATGTYATTNIAAFQKTLGAKINCGSTGCTQTNDIYVFIDAAITWTAAASRTGTAYYQLSTNGGTYPGRSDSIACGSGTSGSCSYRLYEMIPKAQISPSYTLPYHILINVQLNSSGGTMTSVSITYHYEMSDAPIGTENCLDNYDTSAMVGSGAIAGNDENGITLGTNIGSKYRFTVRGGPWHDGTNDRYDIKVSLDGGTTWKVLGELAATAECWQSDYYDPHAASVIFTATAGTFKAKVNDTPGAFGNNTGGMQYEFDRVVSKQTASCSNQYLTGDLLTSGTIQANSSSGNSLTMSVLGIIPSPLAQSGSWLLIQITGGGWKNGGTGNNLYTFQFRRDGGSWTEASAYDGTGCYITTGSYPSAYIQIGIDRVIDLRVNDPGGVFSDNTGSLSYSVYGITSYDRYPDECEKYFAKGNLLYTKNVSGSASAGIRLTVEDQTTSIHGLGGADPADYQRYWVIEDNGLWNDGGSPLADADIRKDAGSWGNIKDFPGSVCTVRLDPIGHYRIYIPVGATEIYGLRARDDDYNNNSGEITFNVYEGIKYQIVDIASPLNTSTCDPYYTHDLTGLDYPLIATNEQGYTLQKTWNNGDIIAIETKAGPFTDNGVNSYYVDISDDGGATYHRLDNYPSLLCAQTPDGDHVLAYIQAAKGAIYKLRVYDAVGNWSNNAGQITTTVYHATTNINPFVTCSGNYPYMVEIPLSNNKILANLEGGITIPNLQNGITYAVKMMGSFIDNGSSSSSTQIGYTNGGAVTWEDIAAGATTALCYEQSTNGTNTTYTYYFQANYSGYKLRAKDGNSNYSDNSGYMTYALYQVSANENDANTFPGISQIIPPDVQAACYQPCSRPSGVISIESFPLNFSFGELGDINTAIPLPVPVIAPWLEYFRCQIQKFFAFCPEHLAAIRAILGQFNNLEPFGTLTEISQAYTGLRDLFNQYDWNTAPYAPYSIVAGGGGGDPAGNSNNPWGEVVPILPSDSPWMGGSIALGGETPQDQQAVFLEFCNQTLGPYLGVAANVSCNSIAMVRSLSSFLLWVQLLLDVRGVGLLIRYIRAKWVDLGTI